MSEQFIYITGDFFVSETDCVNLPDLLNENFNNGFLLINLEGVPRLNKVSQSKAVPLSQNKSVFELLSKPNLYFSLVNNHICDFGSDSLKAALDILADRGLYSSSKEADPRRMIGSKNIIFFADDREECNSSKNGFLRFDRSVINKYSKEIRDSIVIIHGGIEYRKEPTPYQRMLSHLLVDHGATAVIFHHSHIQGDYEFYNDRFIHYGLGNFYFSLVGDLHGSEELDGAVVRISLNTGSVALAEVKYCMQDVHQTLQLKLDFESVDTTKSLPDLNKYTHYYRNKYKLDSSFRPRQLYSTEFLIIIQYYLWYAIASPLVKMGWSKSIKNIVRKIF